MKKMTTVFAAMMMVFGTMTMNANTVAKNDNKGHNEMTQVQNNGPKNDKGDKGNGFDKGNKGNAGMGDMNKGGQPGMDKGKTYQMQPVAPQPEPKHKKGHDPKPAPVHHHVDGTAAVVGAAVAVGAIIAAIAN